MGTKLQELGTQGENLVCRHVTCPKCKKKASTLRKLPTNFKCADVICDFCGYLAQVKTSRSEKLNEIPDRIRGGAWGPQRAAIQSGIYFPLFVVLRSSKGRSAIFYLSADLQRATMFKKRKPLGPNARRAGWHGVELDFSRVKDRFIKLK